jgi:hypothetical protein
MKQIIYNMALTAYFISTNYLKDNDFSDNTTLTKYWESASL